MPRKKPNVAILHYSCPPVIGGVEFVIEVCCLRDMAMLLADGVNKAGRE